MNQATQAFHGGRLSEAAREFNLPRESFLDFSSNLNVFSPSIRAADWEQWRSAISRYPEADAAGIRDRLATVYRLPAHRILPTAGSIDALYLAARLFSKSKAAIIEPAFADYTRAFESAGCQPVRLALPRESWYAPASEWAPLLDPFDVVVLGNPNNPTGAFQPREQMAQLFNHSWARPKTWLVDEAFIEFVAAQEDETLLPVLQQYPSLIVFRSLTKSWCIPGLRLGFLATENSAWLGACRAMQPPWSVNALTEEWAATFLTPVRHNQLLSGLAELREIKKRFHRALAEIPGLCVHPSVANFLLVELINPSLDASQIYRELGLRGYLIRVCDSFHAMPKSRFIRLAVRTEDENTQLTNALSKLARRDSSIARIPSEIVPEAHAEIVPEAHPEIVPEGLPEISRGRKPPVPSKTGPSPGGAAEPTFRPISA